MDPASHLSDRETRLQAALIECLDLVEQGATPDRAALEAKYPDLAGELAEFLSQRARIDALLGGSPLGAMAQARLEQLDPTLAARGQEALGPGSHIRYFGNYELLEEIARGGMGVVYKARQTNLKRIVALKMILAGQLATSEDVKRFYAEAQAAARLEHPHIVPIFEIGQAEGQHYFSMALVEGESLAQRIARGVLDPREAAHIMHKVAQAISFAHVEGVIHRDLKPANILLDKSGEPHVTDFGLAKRVAAEHSGDSSREQLTVTGQVLGTPSYMPPEQASGKVGEVGPQADVYALGAVLYCALAGRPPFQAATPLDTLLQVLEQDPVPLRRLNASVPRDLETIAMKCLQKDPRHRYATAAELAEDLRRFLNDEPIRARPVTSVERAWRWLRGRRRSVGFTAAVVAATLLLASLGLGGWYWYRDWRLGYLSLETDHPPLAAQLVDAMGQLAAPPFTVPTQAAVAVPSGEYELRLSAPRRLSRRYLLSIDRGEPAAPQRLSINLEDSLLRPPGRSATLDVPLSYALVARQGRADVLLLEEGGIGRPAWPGFKDAGPVWSLDLTQPQQHPDLTHAPGLIWPWYARAYNRDLAVAAWHPWVDSPADLDGDGVEDLLIAARHQAWIMAISASQGGVLWLAARGPELSEPIDKAAGPAGNRMASAVLTRPLLVPDADSDGVAELVAVFGSSNLRASPTRFLECLSGRTGNTIWRSELQDAWFQTPGVALPDEATWFVDISGYSSSGGGSYSTGYGVGVVRHPSALSLSGANYPGLFSPLLVEFGGGTAVVAAAGSRLVGIDPASGRHLWPPIDLVLPCQRQPQAADLDGDGQPEVVLLQPEAASLGRVRAASVVSAWSLARCAKIWEHVLAAEAPVRRPKLGSPLPIWPYVADLEGDGRSEVIVSDAVSWAAGQDLPWADLLVLETVGGGARVRWQKPIKTMDRRIDFFAAGPDIDGDGVRDVFAASMYAGERGGQESGLYIDAISGADGQTLWWANRPMQDRYVGGLAWWHQTPDGWPLLLVSAELDRGSPSGREVLALSAATGQVVAGVSEFDELLLQDADGDSVQELFLWSRASNQAALAGGQLFALRSSPSEVWRRAGGSWSVTGDLDGDRWADLASISLGGVPVVSAISGRDGRRLWRAPLAGQHPHPTSMHPLDADLDGDGTADLLAYRDMRQGILAFSLRRQFPLEAISGRTGKRLWSVEIPYSSIEGVLFTTARDLDGDGQPEVVFSAFTNWDYPPDGIASTARLQHWLAVMEGRTGTFRWRQPLSPPYDLPGSPVSRPYHVYAAQVAPGWGDLNGDGTLDLLVPGETSNLPELELRALNGVNGSILWRRRLATPANDSDAFLNLSTPLAADLNRDSVPEVLLLEYIRRDAMTDQLLPAEEANAQADAQDQAARHAHLTALANNGRQKWQVQIPVDDQCGRAGPDPARQAVKPMPQVIHTRDGATLVCLGLWGWSEPGKIVVFDGSGRQLAHREVASTHFRPVIHDVNGDGGDDILVISENKLLAMDPAAQLAVTWEWPLPLNSFPIPEPRIVGVLPRVRSDKVDSGEAANAVRTPAVVVQAGSMLYGISGRTGKPVWHWTGPQPHSQTGFAYPGSASLLPGPAPSPACAVFGFGDQLLACVEASALDAGSDASRAARTRALGLHKQARAAAIPAGAARSDPRLLRSVMSFDAAIPRQQMASGLLMSLLVVVVPGWMTLRMIRRRTWGMGTVLAVPLLAALVLTALLVPLPLVDVRPMFPEYDRTTQRLLAALNFAPVVVLFLALLRLAVRRRWRHLLAWCAFAVAAAVGFAYIHRSQYPPLGPGERYTISVWQLPWETGFYLASWVYIVWTGAVASTRLVLNAVRARRKRTAI